MFDWFQRRQTAKTPADTPSHELASLRRQVDRARQSVAELEARLAAEQPRAARLGALTEAAAERARLAGWPAARLGTDRLILDGPSQRRLDVARIAIGEAVEYPLAARLGVIESATADPRVQALWGSLQGEEPLPDDEALRGAPSSVLDVPDAVVCLEEEGRTLRVTLQPQVRTATGSEPASDLLAIPKFTFDFAPRKLRNFGHFLLDCVPQVVALTRLAPTARFLLPAPLRGFQRATLELVGLPAERALAWDGSRMHAGRVLVFESDGRVGGRPLSALLETRRLLATRGTAAARAGSRRIYVSRRDAEPKRRWVANEPEVEALFAARGFEVMVMEGCPLEEQIRVFRDAHVVAGVSGAGLSDIIFSAPDTHLIVLLSDSLMTWYADQRGSRSSWTRAAAVNRRLSNLGDSPYFYVHLAAAFEQYCHCFLGNDEMPIGRLSGFLDAVLARVDGKGAV